MELENTIARRPSRLVLNLRSWLLALPHLRFLREKNCLIAGVDHNLRFFGEEVVRMIDAMSNYFFFSFVALGVLETVWILLADDVGVVHIFFVLMVFQNTKQLIFLVPY